MPPPIAHQRRVARSAHERALSTLLAHAPALAKLGALSDEKLLVVVKKHVSGKNLASISTSLTAAGALLTRVANVFASRRSGSIVDAAIAQARKARRALVAHKVVLPSGEMTERLGITRQALSKAIQSGRMFAVELDGVQYYPRFFADPVYSRRELGSVSKALGNRSGWEKFLFFTTPKASLQERTPLEALESGQFKRVLTAAAGYAER